MDRYNFSYVLVLLLKGPYAVPTGSLDTANSPAVKSLTFCLRAQFVHIQAALTPQSLSAFWTALSMRLYDVIVARLLQHYYVSMVVCHAYFAQLSNQF